MEYIPPLAPGRRLPSLKGTTACILLAGMLSMLCAEVFSGASVLWIVQPWGWLVTLPLYLAHLLFFLNLAMYFRRTSLPSLYFWGVLFALYETWITKVAWAGYLNQPQQVNTILGFAPGEFLVIILFWHPVMSFIIPVLLIETLSLSSSRTNPVFSGHIRLLEKKPRNLLLFCGIAVIGSTFLSLNSQYNIVAALATLIGTAFLIAVLWYCTEKWTGCRFSVFSLSLGKPGFIILCLYLGVLYPVSFLFLFPERTAPGLTLVLTVLMYAAVALVIWKDRPIEEVIEIPEPSPRIIGTAGLLKYLAGMVAFIVLFCLLPAVAYPVGIGLYVALMAAGAVIFIGAFWQVFRRRRDHSFP